MTINIEIPPQDLAALKRLTKLQDDAEAIVWATREVLRLNRLKELKSVSGKVDYEANWQKYEELETGESKFPE